MIKFVLHSYIFKRLLYATAGFFVLLLILDKVFDLIWKTECLVPVSNLNDVYKTPQQYDNLSKLNLMLEGTDKLNLEGNKRFIIAGSNKVYDYYATVNLIKPDKEPIYTNRIYIQFENTQSPDSIYLTISKSFYPGINWNQIFYSSVRIENLNKFSRDPSEFRLDPSLLVSKEMLENNDSLINEVKHYFNINKDNLGLKECGTNCNIFKSICDIYSVPCRTVELQGGDATESGYNITVGYPIHVVCEVYSSRYRKWYVIDPSYGSAYFYKNLPLNAVEISNKVFFSREKEIIQDSILTTRNLILNLDYFKFYENLYFFTNYQPNLLTKKYLKWFYGRYNYGSLLYSSKMDNFKNAREYFILKSSAFLILTLIYINFIIIILMRRLLKLKKK